jgi:uncharacterized membrane protein YsdA (DUF1294 family)
MSLAPDRRASQRDLSRPLPAALSWITLSVFVIAFAIAYVVLELPWPLLMVYTSASLLAFATYGLDKRAAKRATNRTSEGTLLLYGWLGGWPGALVAQQVFRHKTRKRTFRRAFWLSVVGNLLLLAVFVVAVVPLL